MLTGSHQQPPTICEQRLDTSIFQNRPHISIQFGKICHDSVPCRVVIRRNTISVGCSDVDVQVLHKLLDVYAIKFPKYECEEYIIQP